MCQFISTQTTLLEYGACVHACTHRHTHTHTLNKARAATPCPVVNSSNPCLTSQMGTLERNCCISFLSQQPVVAGVWATETNKMVPRKLKMANRKLGHFWKINACEVAIFRGHRFPGVTFASTFITGVWYCSSVDQILHTCATCHQRANSTRFLRADSPWSLGLPVIFSFRYGGTH